MAESLSLVVATSGRAIAQSLKALDYPVAVIDGFADQDTITAARVCKKVKRTQFGLDESEVINAIGMLGNEYTFSSLFYDAAIEMNPELLNEIKVENIVGNFFETLQRCKDPHQFFPVLDNNTIPYPEVRFNPDNLKSTHWLTKHSRSTGGLGVGNNVYVADKTYFQKYIKGVNVSVTFLANGEEIKVLGVNTQWNEQLGDAIPFAYAGAINQTKLTENEIATSIRYTQIIAKEFGLIGLNSIDFICNEKDIYVLEVNPRITATYELYETKYGDVMREHIAACRERVLPTTERTTLLRAHAIIYAPKDICIPIDFKWPLWTADRPHPGEEISQFEPICNVFSGGKNFSQVCEMIATRKKAILNKLAT